MFDVFSLVFVFPLPSLVILFMSIIVVEAMKIQFWLVSTRE